MEKDRNRFRQAPSLDKQSQRRGFRALPLARPESGTSLRKLVLATDWTTLVTGEKVWTRS
jgi:hypothetical protein